MITAHRWEDPTQQLHERTTFYPAGLLSASLLPKKWHLAWRMLLVTVVFAALSAGIEYIQYAYALGKVEIDDVIHNAFGALLGCICGILHSPYSSQK